MSPPSMSDSIPSALTVGLTILNMITEVRYNENDSCNYGDNLQSKINDIIELKNDPKLNGEPLNKELTSLLKDMLIVDYKNRPSFEDLYRKITQEKPIEQTVKDEFE